MLGRYGAQQAQHPPTPTDTPPAAVPKAARGTGHAPRIVPRDIMPMESLPKNYVRPEQLKHFDWKGLTGHKLVWATKVLNEVPCMCNGRQQTLAYCLQNEARCKPDKNTVGSILNQIRDGVHYTRVLARYAPSRKPEPPKAVRDQTTYTPPTIANVEQFLKKTPRIKVPVGNAPSLGSNDALVTLVKFSDFQCGFCGRAVPTIKQLHTIYGNKLRVVFKHMPLRANAVSHLAAQATLAAHAQGQFWKYQELLFANSRNLQKPQLLSYARQLGLDDKRMEQELTSGKYKADVDADSALARKLGVNGAPTFFVNGRQLVGAMPIDHFRRMIDEEIQVAQALLNRGVASTELYDKLMAEGEVAQKEEQQKRAEAARKKHEMDQKRFMVPEGKSPTQGPKDAPITVVEFSNFQCPFGSRGANTIKQVMEHYQGKIRLIYKHFPLDFQKQSHPAAQASLAAHAQGKFWEYHDKLYANQRKIQREDLIQYARELGLDVNRFQRELDAGTYKKDVDDDQALGQSLGVQGTPTFFINGKRVVGALPLHNFKSTIDQELSGKTAKVEMPKVELPRLQVVPSKPAAIAQREEPKPAPTTPTPSIAAVRTQAGTSPVPTDGSPTLGQADAPVVIVEFSNFQCGFCSRGANTMKEIYKHYQGKVRLVFKHLPLAFHQHAHLAAQASMAAHAQGKFWEYQEKLFANQRNLQKHELIGYAQEIGLDLDRFRNDLDNGTYKNHVDNDMAHARSVGATGTPTFFVNSERVVGALPFARFKDIVDRHLATKGDAAAKPAEPTPTPPPAPRPPTPSMDPKQIPIAHSPTTGPNNAPITVVKFSNFECPFCSRGAATTKQIQNTYGDKVQIVYKHLPLSFHRHAHLAAQASMAAHAQGKFWEYHDKLYANQRKLEKHDLIEYAKEIGLDLDRFQRELDAGTYKKLVDEDIELAKRVDAQGTPIFFVNGQKIIGAQPFHRFKEVIDSLLTQKPAPSAPQPQAPAAVPSQPPTKAKFNLEGTPSIGPNDATITIVVFSEFQCPFCSRGAKAMDDIRKEYGNKVRVVFKHLPLPFHKQAHLAAQASMAAHAQGKFWEYHDKLFANQRNIQKDDLLRYAQELGLDLDRFRKELDDGTYKAYIDKDLEEARKIGANGTPTFYINEHQVVGAQPLQRFKQVIDAVLAGKPVPSEERQPQRPPQPKGPVKLNLEGAPSIGSNAAPITIAVFSEFQCPFCSRGAKTMDDIRKEYGDKVRVVFKHLPLDFHQHAHLAAQASMAAHAQGKFWEYHDKLFANQRNIQKDDLLRYAQELGLDLDRFRKELDDGTYKAYIDKDLEEARNVGANGTPTFYINGNQVVGAQPLQRFKQVIDALLAGKPVPSEEREPQRPPQPKGPVKLNLEGAPGIGPNNAPITIAVFSEFQCPFCSRGAKTTDDIRKEYGDKVRIVFKHLPLPFHQHAHLAAQASMAAHAQGKFWEYHDKLFANQRNIQKDDLLRYAQELGLDLDRFRKELDDGTYKAYVDKDAEEASRVGANGTPTFYINGEQIVGAQPIHRFKQVIDKILSGKIPSDGHHHHHPPHAPPKGADKLPKGGEILRMDPSLLRPLRIQPRVLLPPGAKPTQPTAPSTKPAQPTP
jgi:protein-disulfide isomerase